MTDHLSPQDKSLWQRVMDSVNPLSDRDPADEGNDDDARDIKGDKGDGDSDKKSHQQRRSRRANQQSQRTRKQRQERASKPSVAPLADFIKYPRGRVPGLDRATQRRFRTGKMAIDMRIDLHGLSRDRAMDQLRRFIDDAYDHGQRHCLIITGKGQGILRRATYQFLTNPSRRSKILGISNAQKRHGGKGAYYVLLRRNRDR